MYQNNLSGMFGEIRKRFHGRFTAEILICIGASHVTTEIANHSRVCNHVTCRSRDIVYLQANRYF